MSASRLSSENLHASCVALDGRAVLIVGPSGAGKSDLALRLLDRRFVLVSDDRTIVSKQGAALIASAPDPIKGKLEVRGVGIVEVDQVQLVPVAMIVELTTDIERLPDDGLDRQIMGIAIPLIRVDALTASAPSKVALALDRLGLRF